MELQYDLFPALHVKQAVYTRVEGFAPWGVDLIAYRHTKFGIVTEGECFIDLKDGNPPAKLTRGTCYLLPRGDAFRLRDRLDSGTEDFEHALQRLVGRDLRVGANGERTVVIGGRFIFANDRYPSILDLLPPLIHFKVSDAELRALESTVAMLANETTTPSLGSTMMVDRLADIFFIQSLRAYLLSANQRDVGWIGAVTDDKLSAAIRVIHNECEKAWTIERLAEKVGMSRAVFAARFKNTVGIAPMAYLTRYRLQQAQHLLSKTPLSLAQIALKVGYDSEAAFNKAFKRELGVPPGMFRKSVVETI